MPMQMLCSGCNIKDFICIDRLHNRWNAANRWADVFEQPGSVLLCCCRLCALCFSFIIYINLLLAAFRHFIFLYLHIKYIWFKKEMPERWILTLRTDFWSWCLYDMSFSQLQRIIWLYYYFYYLENSLNLSFDLFKEKINSSKRNYTNNYIFRHIIK